MKLSMKPRNAVLATAIVASLFVVPAFADDAHHPAESGQEARKAPDKAIKSMRDNVAKMKKQLDAIARAKTDEERNKLIAEHVMTMRENMMMAREMGDGMNCPMTKGGMMGGMGTGDKPSTPEERMDRMEKRMDMMQMMMDHMMKQGSPDGDSTGMGSH